MDNRLVLTVLLVTLSWLSVGTYAQTNTNFTADDLETPVNNTGCGTEQLCAAEPASCNPAEATSCFFLSARRTNGQNFEFELAGQSEGYIAATLSSNATLGGNDTTYVCANSNGTVLLITALLDNGTLTPTPLNVSSVRGSVNGSRIQCTFTATVPDPAAATSGSTGASSVALAISIGSFNSTSGAVGVPKTQLQSLVVNLTEPNTTITNQVPSTTNTTTASPSNMTAAPTNMTAAPTNMTAAPVNMITADNLETPVNNTGCGTEQLCAAEPASCNPAVEGSCFFLSARQTNGQNFAFGLAGQSEGYIAATLSSGDTSAGNGPTYICANNNGTVLLITALLNNSTLTVTPLNVSDVRGSVNGSRIQCTFTATVPDSAASTSRSTRASSVALTISTGSFNSTSGAVGVPKTQLQSPAVNLTNPNTTITNQATTASPSNMTTAPTTMTTAPTNMTAAPTNMTAAPTNMTAAPVNMITADNLETPVSNTGCGTEQLCAAEPASCNPAEAGSCFFLSARLISGQTFGFGLAGQSEGYIAASLSSDSAFGGNDTTFACANNNGTVVLITALFDNGTLTPTPLNVSDVRGSVNGSRIQCTFTFTVPDPTVSTRTTNVAIIISNGTFDSTTGTLGSPQTRLMTDVANLADPGAFASNTTNAPTTSPPSMTTSHAITLQQSLMQAMLIAAGVLSLFML